MSKADPTAERTIHTLRSSNLPFYIAVWTAAKSCTGLVLFNKRFYWDNSPPRTSDRTGKLKKNCAVVDIVAQGGGEWIKVSTITETRLLFEKAKADWERAGSCSDSEDEGDGTIANGPLFAPMHGDNHSNPLSKKNESDEDEDDDHIELLKVATDLQKASRAIRVRYNHPHVHFVLPKIHEGHHPSIDNILISLRATGATVQCFNNLPTLSLPQEPLAVTFERLLPNPFATFTPTLNIDCTILLALVSDLSHATIAPIPSEHHRAIRRQIELEAEEQLLPSSLWPAMDSHELVCANIAAARMREIVQTIGTPSERMRTELLFAEGEAGTGKSGAELRQAFQKTTQYPVPGTWQLPIKILSEEIDPDTLDAVQKVAAEGLSVINQSVFLTGWVNGWTTVSSNRGVAKLIEGVVVAMAMAEEQDVVERVKKGAGEITGPDIWICSTARSLVGKEKVRRGGGGGADREGDEKLSERASE